MEVFISDLSIAQAIKKRTKFNGLPHVFSNWGYCGANHVKIPVMYSRATLDLANNMNFKVLAQMSQVEKYPPERILNSAKFVENLIVNEILPFFEKFKNTMDIYHYLIEKATKDPDFIHLSEHVQDIFKEYAVKLGVPDLTQNNKINS
jgi:hypothetical protein